MKLFLFLFLSVQFFSSMAQTINKLENGLKQGFWIEPEGEGAWHGYYKDGKRDGSWSYYEGHAILKTASYIDGSKKGHGYIFGPDGNLLISLEFDQDRIHGRARFFSSGGQHIATYTYVYDKLDRIELYILHDESPPKAKTYLPEF